MITETKQLSGAIDTIVYFTIATIPHLYMSHILAKYLLKKSYQKFLVFNFHYVVRFRVTKDPKETKEREEMLGFEVTR